MNRILVPLYVLLIGFHFASAQEKDASAKKAGNTVAQDQKFVDMEKMLWEAWKNKDRKPYEDALAPNFFEVDVTGSYDKTAIISYIDKCDLKDYAIIDPRVTWLNKETVLLTYRMTLHDICEGQPVPEHVIANIVFVRQQGKWREAFHSEVPQSTAK